MHFNPCSDSPPGGPRCIYLHLYLFTSLLISFYFLFFFCFIELSLFLYCLFISFFNNLELYMIFILENWDTIVLLITNVVAYFAKSPLKPKS